MKSKINATSVTLHPFMQTILDSGGRIGNWLAHTNMFFSVTRRSRSDSVSESVTLRTELTDVTLVSEDTY